VRSAPESPQRGPRTSPSFAGRKPASPQASGIKSRNRKNDTTAELALRHILWRLGLRYRVNKKGLPGTPDIVFSRQRIVVFVDGDFWHGRDWEQRKARLSSGNNADYWIAKIGYNRERDRINENLLAELGWKVIRLWETDVLKDPECAARRILGLVAPEARPC
jgi:DNA mismatch endonuclease, patch repair protein